MATIDEDLKENWLMWRLVLFGGETYQSVNSMSIKTMVNFNNALTIKSKIELFMLQKESTLNEQRTDY